MRFECFTVNVVPFQGSGIGNGGLPADATSDSEPAEVAGPACRWKGEYCFYSCLERLSAFKTDQNE